MTGITQNERYIEQLAVWVANRRGVASLGLDSRYTPRDVRIDHLAQGYTVCAGRAYGLNLGRNAQRAEATLKAMGAARAE